MNEAEANSEILGERGAKMRKRATRKAELEKQIEALTIEISDAEDDIAALQQRRAGLRNELSALDDG